MPLPSVCTVPTFLFFLFFFLTVLFDLYMKFHPLTIFSPGPEPPTDLMFSNITETSVSVSWGKPKSIVAEFKVTYTNIVTGTVNVFELSCFSVLTIKCYCFQTNWCATINWDAYNALPFYAAGESGSMSVDSQLSHVLLSKLSAGSTYDITVSSVLETLESEPITASVTTG